MNIHEGNGKVYSLVNRRLQGGNVVANQSHSLEIQELNNHSRLCVGFALTYWQNLQYWLL